MIMTQYTHRLPVDYDLGTIRARAAERQALWADVPDLYFKAFLLRKGGRLGATSACYSSLYLWKTEDALREWIAGRRFDYVVDAFGRPPVSNSLALAARRGRAEAARYAVVEEIDVALDASFADAVSEETARVAGIAAEPTTVAAAVGVDTLRWRFKRIVLREDEPATSEPGLRYEAIAVAAPLLEALARA